MIFPAGSIIEMGLPIVGSMTGICTIVRVYFLSSEAGRIPPDMLTPPISLLGCNDPEHTVYQIGFALTGFLLLLAIEQWRHGLLPRIQQSSFAWTSLTMLLGGYLAAAGVALQGLMTLEEDFLSNIKEGRPMRNQSIYHQQFAGIFFLGAAMHCYGTTYYIFSSSRQANKSEVGNQKSSERTSSTGADKHSGDCCYGTWSVRLKLFCSVLSILSWPLAEYLHPTRRYESKHNLNIAGLAQYLAVGSYILFFGSYSLDFAGLRRVAISSSKPKDC